MQVRLAFSVMVQSDPDVLLIDEVLAVGDAAFQQKCIDVFYRLRSEGKTIVLVTHEMGLVERFCHRAMKLSGGDITHIGDPAEIGRAYMSENFATRSSDVEPGKSAEAVRLVDAWITDAEDARVDAISYRQPMRMHVIIEALEAIQSPAITTWLTNEDNVRVFSTGARENGDALGDIEPGEQLHYTVNAENPLSAGRYYLGCAVTRGTAGLETLFFQNRAADVVSFGAQLHGLVGIEHSGEVVRTRSREII
jgi:ABC-type proline/glycine betaine transport system ATPase subunit